MDILLVVIKFFQTISPFLSLQLVQAFFYVLVLDIFIKRVYIWLPR